MTMRKPRDQKLVSGIALVTVKRWVDRETVSDMFHDRDALYAFIQGKGWRWDTKRRVWAERQYTPRQRIEKPVKVMNTVLASPTTGKDGIRPTYCLIRLIASKETLPRIVAEMTELLPAIGGTVVSCSQHYPDHGGSTFERVYLKVQFE